MSKLNRCWKSAIYAPVTAVLTAWLAKPANAILQIGQLFPVTALKAYLKMMIELALAESTVYGRVQGVFFRAFVSKHAEKLGLTGYVRNLPGGKAVAVRAEGERKKLEELISYLKVGPPAARVEKVVTSWSEYTGDYSEFSIK